MACPSVPVIYNAVFVMACTLWKLPLFAVSS